MAGVIAKVADKNYIMRWQMLLPLWLMEWPHCEMANVVAIVAGGIATQDRTACMADVVAFVADGIAPGQLFIFSHLLLF